MSLMQEILAKIENRAVAASAAAIRATGLIAEAEALRAVLWAHGLPNAEASFVDTSTPSIVFYLTSNGYTPANVRAALAAAEIVVAEERRVGRDRIELKLAGLDCVIWIAAEQPLALVA